MFKGLLVITAFVFGTGAAGASEYELKWDDGTLRYLFNFIPGPGAWLGNDFDTATLAAPYVGRLRVAAYRGYNNSWDGFRVALWAFDGVPGSMIWPTSGTSQYVLPTLSTTWGWV